MKQQKTTELYGWFEPAEPPVSTCLSENTEMRSGPERCDFLLPE
jgi:hypothetical protein